MKITKNYLLIAACLISSLSVFAELPDHIQVSTASNEHWYFIQNSINHTETGTAVFRSGTYITSFGGDATSTQVRGNHILMSGNRDYQLWKLVESADSTGYYYLVNKATQNALSIGNGTPLAGTNGENIALGPDYGNRYYTVTGKATTFYIDKCRTSAGVKVSDKYVSVRRTIAGQYNKNLLSAFGQSSRLSVFDYNQANFSDQGSMTASMKNPRAWAFIPEAEGNARYPQLSSGAVSHWYNIVSAGSDVNFNGKCITAVQNLSQATCTELSESSTDNQKWKFLRVNNNPLCDSVYLVSAGGLYLNRSGQTVNVPSPLVIQHFFAEDNQVRFVPYSGDSIKENNSPTTYSKALYINASGAIVQSTSANNYVYNSAAAFKIIFKETTTDVGTGVNVADSKKVSLNIVNGYVVSEGTDMPVEVFTIHGLSCNPNSRLAKGVYVLRCGETIQKVVYK